MLRPDKEPGRMNKNHSVEANQTPISGQDADRELAKIHGAEIDEDDEPDPKAPIDCPSCGRETPREKDFCVWCNQATSHDAVEEIMAEEQDLRDAILKLIKEDPEVLDDIEKAQDAMTIFENRPDLLQDAKQFREALGDT